jgi:hypothetical protein
MDGFKSAFIKVCLVLGGLTVLGAIGAATSRESPYKYSREELIQSCEEDLVQGVYPSGYTVDQCVAETQKNLELARTADSRRNFSENTQLERRERERREQERALYCAGRPENC